MTKVPRKADKVRASRDGHEYHDAWTARKAMQLLLGDDHLIGIAVEGLEPDDQTRASRETVEIADLTLYYGQGTGFDYADKVDVVQFKYSPSHENAEFRASDAKKTITKFAASYRDYNDKYGARQVEDKLCFSLITNRPIYLPLTQAIRGLAAGKRLSGQAKEQAMQFKTAANLDRKSLAAFASKCQILGLSGSLIATKRGLSMLLVDWSATPDALATARLGKMRDMVRNKAGYVGTGRNIIRDTDVLATLKIPDKEALLPCPASLAEVGEVVTREQLPEAVDLIPTLSKPLLIHAAGGVGKTVFIESLAKALEDRYEVVFFDCFGGGAWRSPEDARHLPKHGLVHIANSLACRGFCDPIFPGSDDLETLLKTVRRRLDQCVRTLSRISPKKQLLIVLDAIDNAAEQARERHEDSFPTRLLESFQHAPIPGLTLVASSRSHRIPIKHIPYHDFKLLPFSPPETATYLSSRLPHVTDVELRVAQARSDGNPRILEHLVNSGRGLLEPSEIDNKIELTDLIEKRLDHALLEAMKRGYKAEDTDAFLAGLAVLPPPVPLDEYAEAHGMELPAIESFVSDLWPLLERTKHGLLFRDEPTETLVREKYASRSDLLRRVASNLLARQDRSVYAARALPGLLQKLGDGEQLFTLAFDDRFPATITSTVGKRNIRYARLMAAVHYAANQQDYDRLVHLLLELSTIAAVDRRGTDYILDSPDLVVAARDVDATRRLFETHTAWQGTRHARLTIVHTLSGDLDEASRHALRTNDWLNHYWQQDRDHDMRREGPDHFDIAAIPFFLITQNQYDRAIRFMRRWKDWYAYEVGEHLFGLLEQRHIVSESDVAIKGFRDVFTKEIGCIAAAISFLELARPQQKKLIEKLVHACRNATKLDTSDDFHQRRNYRLQDGLRKASAVAASLQLRAEAGSIAKRVPYKRPDTWSFRDPFADQYVFPFLFHVALTAALKCEEVREKHIVPTEIVPICNGLKGNLSGAELRTVLKERLESRWRAAREDADTGKKTITYEKKLEAEQFIERQLAPLLELTKAFAALLRAPVGKADNAFRHLLTAWADARSIGDYYTARKHDPFFQMMGCQVAAFALWARSDLKIGSAREFLNRLHEQERVSSATLIQIVAIMAKRKTLQSLAGEEAIKIRSIIEAENEVTHKASLYAELARAILHTSTDEAATYFRAGLDQMDAIGSGDYQFTNELLLFASSLRGQELEDRDFHTLTNICELNLTDEPEKFPWFAFGKAMSRLSGCRGLAKLSRWDDRSKVSLDYTLLPYITALIEDRKIAPEDALALNRLADPVELYSCNTETLANAIASKHYPSDEALVLELITQFEENNPCTTMETTVKALAGIAREVLGKTSGVTKRLAKAHPHFARVRDEQNEHMNYHGRAPKHVIATPDIQNTTEVRNIVRGTNPVDEVSLGQALADLEKIGGIYSLKEDFFAQLRAKVEFNERAQYLRALSNLEGLNLYTKLEELQKCKALWGASSASLTDAYKALALTLLQLHTDDMLSYGQLSGHQLGEISELSGIPVAALALELVKLYSASDSSIPATVWLALGSFVCDKAREGEGQKALKRLLNSEAAKLSSTVIDGEWKMGVYPNSDPLEITAGLVWRMLGSPSGADRWQAAHSVRRFAKLARWNIVDCLVGMLDRKDAGPFQAPELPFYYMHARLWLLIALARIAIDDPKAIAKYKDVLLDVVCDKYGPHVLMRHFAARTLITIMDAKEIEIPLETEKLVRNTDRSPTPQLRQKLKHGTGFYGARPETAPKPKAEFHLDYDFNKYDVQNLSDVFGRPGWEVIDRLSEIALEIDPKVGSMYDSGGRDISRRYGLGGMTSSFHTYGQQLGWHALQLTAGEFLSKYPVTDDWIYDEPWDEWLGRYLLTRSDGLWLADGVDQAPLDVVDILLEKGDEGLVLTGDKTKLLRLIGLHSGVSDPITVSGFWYSKDHVHVHISSVLVVPHKAARVAKGLIDEEPMLVWLPQYGEHSRGEEYLMSQKPECVPWVVSPSGEGKLDEHDLLGSVRAVRRPRIAQSFASPLGLRPDDPFARVWVNGRGRILARAEAWGQDNEHSEEPTVSGGRLLCSRRLVKSVLRGNNSDLLMLVALQRYEKGYRPHSEGKYTHTVAAIRVTKSLDVKYYKGRINYLYKPRHVTQPPKKRKDLLSLELREYKSQKRRQQTKRAANLRSRL